MASAGFREKDIHITRNVDVAALQVCNQTAHVVALRRISEHGKQPALRVQPPQVLVVVAVGSRVVVEPCRSVYEPLPDAPAVQSPPAAQVAHIRHARHLQESRRPVLRHEAPAVHDTARFVRGRPVVGCSDFEIPDLREEHVRARTFPCQCTALRLADLNADSRKAASAVPDAYRLRVPPSGGNPGTIGSVVEQRGRAGQVAGHVVEKRLLPLAQKRHFRHRLLGYAQRVVKRRRAVRAYYVCVVGKPHPLRAQNAEHRMGQVYGCDIPSASPGRVY